MGIFHLSRDRGFFAAAGCAFPPCLFHFHSHSHSHSLRRAICFCVVFEWRLPLLLLQGLQWLWLQGLYLQGLLHLGQGL